MRIKSPSPKLAGLCTAAILCTSSLCWAASDELSRGDKQFLQDASELALGEIELGKIAQSNGSSLDVKQLGICPQCGFSTNVFGTEFTIDDERRKIERMVDVANEVWGTA